MAFDQSKAFDERMKVVSQETCLLSNDNDCSKIEHQATYFFSVTKTIKSSRFFSTLNIPYIRLFLLEILVLDIMEKPAGFLTLKNHN